MQCQRIKTGLCLKKKRSRKQYEMSLNKRKGKALEFQ